MENDRRNLGNFHQNTWKSQNWDLDSFIQSRKRMSLNIQRSYVSWQLRMMQMFEKNWLVVSKLTWGIWRILTPTLESFKNLQFNEPVLTQIYNAWARKVQRKIFFFHWRMMQNLKKNWLVLSKMTWGIWQIFTGWKIAISFYNVKWSKNSKQPDRSDAMWKLYFTLETN